MHGRRWNRGNLLVILGLLGGSILPLASSFPVGKLLGLILSEKDFMNNRINRHIELLLRRLFLETQDPNMDPCTPVGPQGDRCQARGLQCRLILFILGGQPGSPTFDPQQFSSKLTP